MLRDQCDDDIVGRAAAISQARRWPSSIDRPLDAAAAVLILFRWTRPSASVTTRTSSSGSPVAIVHGSAGIALPRSRSVSAPTRSWSTSSRPSRRPACGTRSDTRAADARPICPTSLTRSRQTCRRRWSASASELSREGRNDEEVYHASTVWVAQPRSTSRARSSLTITSPRSGCLVSRRP